MTHSVGRRLFLQGTLAGSMATLGLATVRAAAAAGDAAQPQRQVLFLWLAGGASQFEMWDPKPNRPTGGPFRSIPTSVPGVHFCELMPRLAQRMDRLTVIRSLSTGISEHELAADLMSTGRPKEPALVYPEIGVVLAKELATGRSPLPDYVSVFRTSEGRRKAGVGFLGAAHTPVHLETASVGRRISSGPPGRRRIALPIARPCGPQLSRGFLAGRAGREGAEQYEAAHQRVAGLMDSAGPVRCRSRAPA